MKSADLLSAIIVIAFVPFFAFAQTRTIAELPMRFRGPSPAVEVMVNGKGPFLFAIDTAAQGQARLDETLVKTLGLEPAGEVRGSDGSGTNPRAMQVYEAASIKVGSLEFKNVRAPSRNYNPRPEMQKIDGILGFNLFKDYLLTLDFPGKKVWISTGALWKGENVIAFEAPNGVPLIELGIGAEKIKAHIDTGNMVAPFILPAETVEKLGKSSEPTVVGRARTVSNEVEIMQVQVKAPIFFGPFKYESPTVNYPAFGPANVGSRALSEYVLTFDQRNMLVKIERAAQAQQAPASRVRN